MHSAVPILRMFDVELTTAFYRDYLGFDVEWVHRFAPNLPVYQRMRFGDCVIDLSQHYGDASPAGAVWIHVDDVAAYHQFLVAQEHPFSRPGVEADGPGGATMTVIDPASNQLRFAQPGD